MFGKLVIRLGDPTSHGGQVVSAASNFDMFGKQVARIGDKVTCPQKGHGVCTIVEGDPTWTIDGRNVALEGHKTSCGAVLISTLPNVHRSYEGMGTASYGSPSAELAATFQRNARSDGSKRFDEQIRISDGEGNVLANLAYTAKLASGELIRGVTDENGLTDRYFTDAQEVVEVYVGHIGDSDGEA